MCKEVGFTTFRNIFRVSNPAIWAKGALKLKKNDLYEKFHLFQGRVSSPDGCFSPSSGQHCADSVDPTSFIPLLFEHPQAEMQYYSFSESSLSTLLVDTYEVRNTEQRDIYYPILPTPCVCLYFKFNQESIQSVFCGTTSFISSLHLPPNHTVFCARFRPGVSDFFTQTPAKKLTDSTFSLNVFLPSASDLIREVQHCGSFAERTLSIQSYFASHPYTAEYEDHALFNRGARLIHQRHGILRVSEIAETLSCSERYLCRMFNNWVGISTKQYCELVQMQFSLQEILSKRPKTLAKTAISFGYFDQPHMNRVYQKFLGRTASDMLFFNETSCNMTSMPVII